MKIKNAANQKKEILFLIVASVILVLLIIYLFVIVRHLVNKSYDVFGSVKLPENAVARFDFDRYQRVISKVLPTSTLDFLSNSTTSTFGE